MGYKVILTGVYTITCLVNNKIYVGKAVNLANSKDDEDEKLNNVTNKTK